VNVDQLCTVLTQYFVTIGALWMQNNVWPFQANHVHACTPNLNRRPVYYQLFIASLPQAGFHFIELHPCCSIDLIRRFYCFCYFTHGRFLLTMTSLKPTDAHDHPRSVSDYEQFLCTNVGVYVYKYVFISYSQQLAWVGDAIARSSMGRPYISAGIGRIVTLDVWYRTCRQTNARIALGLSKCVCHCMHAWRVGIGNDRPMYRVRLASMNQCVSNKYWAFLLYTQ
jgi:hypothetical protein